MLRHLGALAGFLILPQIAHSFGGAIVGSGGITPSISISTVSASQCLRADSTSSHFQAGPGCGSTEAVFNEASGDVDLRVESNGNANMIFVDGGNDRVGIGTGGPQAVLDVNGAFQWGSGATKSTGTSTGSLNLATPLTAPSGGTGAASLTEGGVLFGGGTGAVTAGDVLANGQLWVGDGTTAPTAATLTGTSLEVDIANGAGTVTIGLPATVGVTTSLGINRADAPNSAIHLSSGTLTIDGNTATSILTRGTVEINDTAIAGIGGTLVVKSTSTTGATPIARFDSNSDNDLWYFTQGGDLVMSINGGIRLDTVDGVDNNSLMMTAGGANGNTARGAYILLDGNEVVGAGGRMVLNAGNTSDHGGIVFRTAATLQGIVDFNGRLGIGTTLPATKLHLSSGTLTIDGNIGPQINATGTVSGSGVGIPSLTTAQVQASTPSRAGVLLYNSTLSVVCVSTGTAVQGYARIDGATACE